MIEIRVSTPALVVVLLGVVLVGVAIGAWAATIAADRNARRWRRGRTADPVGWGGPSMAALAADRRHTRNATTEVLPAVRRYDETMELHDAT